MSPKLSQSILLQCNKALLPLMFLRLPGVERFAKMPILQSSLPFYRYKPAYFRHFAFFTQPTAPRPQYKRNRLSSLTELYIFQGLRLWPSCTNTICFSNINLRFRRCPLFPLTIHIPSIFIACHIA